MRAAIHASGPGPEEELARALAETGYERTDQDEDAHLVLADIGLGVNAIHAVCARVVKGGLGPIVGIVGDARDDEIDGLVDAGVTMCVANDGTLLRRLRFLKRALRQRELAAKLAARVAESEARYRTVIEALDEALLVQDADGRITASNPAAARIFGLTEDELRERPWRRWKITYPDGSIVEPGDVPGLRALRTGEPVRACVIALHPPNRETLWVSINAHPVQTGDRSMSVVSTFHDVSARQRAYEDYRNALDLSFDLVFVHRQGTIVWANQRAVTLLGYGERREIIGTSATEDLTPPRFRALVTDRLRDRAAGFSPEPRESALLRKDGAELPVYVYGAPTMFEGEPAYIAFARDLTAERRMALEVETNARLAALGRLAAGVGHEINNPLTYVIGNLHNAVERLQATRNPHERAAAGAEAIELMTEALDGVSRVQRLVRDLRVFTTRPNDALGPVDVHRVIESCLRVADAQLRHRARLIRDFGDVPKVLANEPRLAQVFLNLLVNAAEAMPDADGRAREASVTVTTRRESDGKVAIRVSDTGEGISTDVLEHVFEPFFTTKGDRGGTGLGLSICHTLVEQQGGDIAIESTRGVGTVVTVRLRADEPSHAVQATALAPRATPSSKGRRILLVDDEIRIVRVLREGLVGHEVTVATSGREALALLEDGRAFDVIVCDLMMPDMTGMEVHDHVRVLRPGFEQRMVFITGGAFTPSATEFLERVANPRLEKPFRIQELTEVIERTAAL